jgi:hypothetical protein
MSAQIRVPPKHRKTSKNKELAGCAGSLLRTRLHAKFPAIREKYREFTGKLPQEVGMRRIPDKQINGLPRNSLRRGTGKISSMNRDLCAA